MLETVTVIREILTTIAAVIGATVAVAGLFTWKKQLRGKTHYELARRYMRSVYLLRESFTTVRNPAVFVGERIAALKTMEKNETEVSDNEAQRAVYSVRWRKVNEARMNLSLEVLEAEISWGKPARDILKELYKCESRLYMSVMRMLDGRSKDADDDIVYGAGDEDAFDKDVNSAIEKIEEYLRPHLR